MYGGIASLLLSEVAAISAAEVVVRVAAAAIGSAAATAATTGGGATLGAAGAGAAGGTAAGPAGTMVGAAVGLLVGLGVDWWMSARLEEDLREQTTLCLDQLEHAIIEGQGSEPGLRRSLDAFCEDYDSVQREALLDALK
jgi:phage tail tape-measure protein